MTTTKTGESPSANTPEKAAQSAKSVEPKAPDFGTPTNIFSEDELKTAAQPAPVAVKKKNKDHLPW